MNDGQTTPEPGQTEAQSQMPQLTRRHLDWVYCLCLRSVHNPALAEDVTQCVFVALLKKSGPLPREAKISGWLFKTARHCCKRALRNDHTRRRHEQAAARMRPDAVAAEAAMRDEELIPLLDEQVSRLGNADRTAVLLRYYECRSLREVGEALGISEEAAKKRVQRAVEKLRARMVGKRIPLGAESLTAVLANKLVQPAPAILAHCAHRTTATAISAGQSKVSMHVATKALAGGKTALVTTGTVLATAMVAAGITAALAHHSHPKATQKIIISCATTYITRPLDKDGLPNYKLALQQYLMKGITPTNNAAVPAIEIAMQGFRAVWDHGRWIDYRKLGAEQLKLLGVPVSRTKFPRVHSVWLFFKQHAPQGFALPSEKSLAMVDTPRYAIARSVEEGYARDFPWRSSQCFLLWAALDRNKAASELMRRGLQLKRFYLPAGDGTHPKWPLSYNLPIADVVRPIGRYLLFRSTLDLGRGHPRHAWRGAAALYRLAVLVRQIPDSAGAYASGTLLSESLCVDRVLLGQLTSRPHLLTRAWKSIRAIPLPPPVTRRYLFAWRLRELAGLCKAYRQSIASSGSGSQARVKIDPLNFYQLVNHPPRSIIWNWQFRRLNATFDGIRDRLQVPTDSKWGQKLREWLNARTSADVELSERENNQHWRFGPKGYVPHELERLMSGKLTPNVRYHNALILSDYPDYQAVNYHLPRMVMLIKIGYALAMFRHDHGRYPASLAELAPEYFRDPPLDPKTGKPMFYRVKGDGYELAMNERILQWHLIPNVPYTPQRIVMPPPAPTGWQKGPFP